MVRSSVDPFEGFEQTKSSVSPSGSGSAPGPGTEPSTSPSALSSGSPGPDTAERRGTADLSGYGWSAGLAEAFEDHVAAPGHVPGRVVRVDRGSCVVVSSAGSLRAAYGPGAPAVGDWVAVRHVPGDPTEITAVLPRGTAIVRGAVERESRGGLSGDSQGQVLAANIDIVFIAEPAGWDTQGSGAGRSGRVPGRAGQDEGPSLGRVERLLAIAWESGATPVVVITKADLAADVPELLATVGSAAPGVDVHAVSSHTGAGLDALVLPRARTAVLLGPSGAGKSTLLNALAGADLMDTQRVRESDGRGRHTTTHRELFALPGGGLIIDTPGLRRIGLYESGEGLAQAFADIEELAEKCRFTDCTHGVEPGCAVLRAVDDGVLPRRRLESWRKLRKEAAWMARRADARLQAEHTRAWKILSKEMRGAGRHRR